MELPQVWVAILALDPPESGICLNLQFLLNTGLFVILCMGLSQGEFTLRGHIQERQPAGKEAQVSLT